jgi:hypothetical protein
MEYKLWSMSYGVRVKRICGIWPYEFLLGPTLIGKILALCCKNDI